MKPVSMELQQLQSSLKALRNLEKIVKSSSFPGSEALSVADAILLLNHLIANCESSIKAEKDKPASEPEVK